MEFIAVKGRQGGNLYYVKEDKHLYVRKTLASGISYLACYNTVLKNQDSHIQGCSARCTLDETKGLCFRNSTYHSHHENHEVVFRDLQSLNAMKEHCRYFALNFPFSAKKTPIKEIFLAEMSKLV